MRRLLVVSLILFGGCMTPAAASAKGDGTSRALVPSGIGAVLDVDAWQDQTCVVLTDHSVRCWGAVSRGTYGRPGAVRAMPTTVPGIDGAAKVSGHCAVKTDGTVWCWADGWMSNDPRPEDAPAQVAGIDGVADLSVGEDATCAVRIDGTVWCWGWPRHGATGSYGAGINFETHGPKQVAGLTGAVTVASGQQHACAVQGNGGLWCWGDGGGGGPTPPTGPLADFVGVVSVGAAMNETCSVDAAGGVRCRGDNTFGEAGVRPDGYATGAASIAGLPPMSSVASAISHTCAVTTSGLGFCWGLQADGRLGNPAYGGDGTSESPIPVLGLTDVKRFVTGNAHTCAQVADGTLRCFGSDALGQLGNGDDPLPADWPIDTPGAIQQAESTTPVRLPTPTPSPQPASTPTPKPTVKPVPQAARTKQALVLTAYRLPLRKAAGCPKKITVRVRPSGKSAPSIRRRIATTAAGGACTVSTTIKLARPLAQAERLVMTVSGAGVERRSRVLVRG